MSTAHGLAAPLVAVCAALTVGLAAGCTSGVSGASGSSGATTTGSSPTSTLVRADATWSAPPPRPSPPSVPALDPLPQGDDTLVSGAGGALTWDVEIPFFTGSVEADEVNRRVDAAARYAAQRIEADAGGTSYATGRSEVTTNDGRTVQVRVTVTDYPQDGSEGVESAATVVLRRDAPGPVFLEEVFADPDAAVDVLAERVTAIAAEQGAALADPAGLEDLVDFADWQTSGDGLELTFQWGQFGPGAPLFVVPWSDVEPLLTPEAAALLAPVA